jgi:hypothetical protein
VDDCDSYLGQGRQLLVVQVGLPNGLSTSDQLLPQANRIFCFTIRVTLQPFSSRATWAAYATARSSFCEERYVATGS